MHHETFDQTRAQHERIVFALQPHWLQYSPSAINALLTTALASASFSLHSLPNALASMTPFFIALTLASLLRTLYLSALVNNQEILLSNQRITHKTGLINRHTEELRLHAIETVEIRQSILQRLFNAGDLHITGRGTSDLYLQHVLNPLHAKQIIETQLEKIDFNSNPHKA